MDALDRLRELEAAATPKPWTAETHLISAPVRGGRPNGEIIIRCEGYVRSVEPSDADAAFLAALRNAAPALLAELAAARECDDLVGDESEAEIVAAHERYKAARRATDAAMGSK